MNTLSLNVYNDNGYWWAQLHNGAVLQLSDGPPDDISSNFDNLLGTGHYELSFEPHTDFYEMRCVDDDKYREWFDERTGETIHTRFYEIREMLANHFGLESWPLVFHYKHTPH